MDMSGALADWSKRPFWTLGRSPARDRAVRPRGPRRRRRRAPRRGAQRCSCPGWQAPDQQLRCGRSPARARREGRPGCRRRRARPCRRTGRRGARRQQRADGVGELLGFGVSKGSGLGRVGGLAPAAPAPGPPRGPAARAFAAGSAAGGLLGLHLVPPGVVPFSTGLLLESVDGFGV